MSTETISSNGTSSASSSTRQAAIANALSYSAPAAFEFVNITPEDVFGENDFSKSVMKKRLPKSIHKSLMQAIDAGGKLDDTVADYVASAM